MFSSSVQPPLVSLLSTTSSQCLALFEINTDASLPADSFVCLLNDASSSPHPPGQAKLISPPNISSGDGDEEEQGNEGRVLNQTVLHIQSPTLRTTSIRCPATSSGLALGLKHPWIHFQIRNMGREWSFEVGIVDRGGKAGVIRCSTFQREPLLKMSRPPLLLLPLTFPTASSRPLTAWSTINLNLASLLQYFSSPSLLAHTDDADIRASRNDQQSRRITVPVPTGSYSHITYVKVYSTCRLRRIWLSEAGPGQSLPLEYDLYGH